jgi:2-amino-4-hydroxy-6-hydroxymethyldihydropteridine diphosphokinase
MDIVYYDDLTMTLENLEIPHPRRAERRFVLEPLAQIAPDYRDPVLGLTLRELLSQACL